MNNAAANAGSAAADPVAAAHARMLHDQALQFSFAGFPPQKPPHVPGWLKALGEVFAAIAPIMPYVFYGIVAAGLAALVYFIGRELIALRWPEIKKKRKKGTTEPDWRPTPAQARALLEDADRLAAEGRYAEAAHLILYRSIEEIQGRRPHLLRPALTSRDIAGLEGLPGRARDAFVAIAELVERSFFGGRAVDKEGFNRCRQAYETFAFAEVWS
ncbi:MAG TPA: DUF4129 domain-containing protein [Caulobacteraceae bacterium]|jgi:hypothetical protein|nr:DUF4129 domain-containing protein [Caulobacteraceae bacterium]